MYVIFDPRRTHGAVGVARTEQDARAMTRDHLYDYVTSAEWSDLETSIRLY